MLYPISAQTIAFNLKPHIFTFTRYPKSLAQQNWPNLKIKQHQTHVNNHILIPNNSKTQNINLKHPSHPPQNIYIYNWSLKFGSDYILIPKI